MPREVNTIKISNELLERGDHINSSGSIRYIRSGDGKSLYYIKHTITGVKLMVTLCPGFNSRLILER